jgi:hypothetical protein
MCAAKSGRPFEVKIKTHIPCPMPDGVRLSNDIYLPDAKGPFPCILVRTPYGNNVEKKVEYCRKFAAAGYAVVIQDVRGRYDSEGDWEPFFNEHDDSLATQAWIAGQDFCDGDIALSGRSYEGYCVWMGAFGHHPAVKAIIPIVALPDPVVNVPWQNGAPMWNMIEWAFYVHGRTNQNITAPNWESLYKFKPLDRLDEQEGFISRPWRDWMAHETKDDYWKPACYMHRMNELDIPALHICGWYDDDGPSTYNNYPNARIYAANKAAKDGQTIIIGPWPHATNTKTTVSGVDFGPEEVIDLDGLIIKWLDRHIGGRPESWDGQPRARIFIMAENKWREWEDWPHPDTKEASFYLHSGGKANSLYGDGKLSLNPPAKGERADEFVYDPNNPAPYIYDAASLQVGGPHDQRAIERRDDVLCYTSDELTDDLIICGRIFAELYVLSSAEDTDFMAKLCDVHPNGLSRQLCDGNIRVALRNSLEKLEPVPAGEIAKLTVDLWATGIQIFKGHRLRLEVSSSAVPKFAMHTNTLEPRGSAVKIVVAHNKVYHDAEHQSRLILPVIQG